MNTKQFEKANDLMIDINNIKDKINEWKKCDPNNTIDRMQFLNGAAFVSIELFSDLKTQMIFVLESNLLYLEKEFEQL